MRNVALLLTRTVVGGYVAAHGAQKLFGSFGGRGIEGTGAGFESMGLAPGPELATVAGASEFGGGVLTALGLGGPIGPIAIASTMATAAGTAHRGKGAFAQTGGPELPIANAAAAIALAGSGFGRFSLDRALKLRVPRFVVALTVAGSAAASAFLISRSARVQEQQHVEPEPEAFVEPERELTRV